MWQLGLDCLTGHSAARRSPCFTLRRYLRFKEPIDFEEVRWVELIKKPTAMEGIDFWFNNHFNTHFLIRLKARLILAGTKEFDFVSRCSDKQFGPQIELVNRFMEDLSFIYLLIKIKEYL